MNFINKLLLLTAFLSLNGCCFESLSTSAPYTSINHFQADFDNIVIYDTYNQSYPLNWTANSDTYTHTYTAQVNNGYLEFFPSSYTSGPNSDMRVDIRYCSYGHGCEYVGSSYTQDPICTSLDYDTTLCTYSFIFNEARSPYALYLPRGQMSIVQEETFVAGGTICTDS